MFAKLVLLVLMISTFGCSSIDKLVQDGIGQPVSTVIERWGPPSRVAPDGSGGHVYIWEHWVDTGYSSGHLWSTMFWTDPKGIIYKWR